MSEPNDLFAAIQRCVEHFQNAGIADPEAVVKRFCRIPRHVSLMGFLDLWAEKNGYTMVVRP